MIKISRHAYRYIHQSSSRYKHAPPRVVDIAKYMSGGLDSSIQSMENVMNILEDAELQSSRTKKERTRRVPVSPFLLALKNVDVDYLNKYTQKFGEQVYRYRVLYEFNSRPYLQSNLWMLEGFNTNFDVLMNRFMTRAISPKSNSFFCRHPSLNFDSKLSYAQTVARYFVLNNVHCMQRLAIDIRQTAKSILQYDKNADFTGEILKLRLKAQPRRIASDPLVIRNALGAKPFRNCLPFLAMDVEVIKYLVPNTTESQTIISAMKCDEAEGELAFEILCKRVLFKIQDSRDTRIVPEQEGESVDVPEEKKENVFGEKQYWESSFRDAKSARYELAEEDKTTWKEQSKTSLLFARVAKVDKIKHDELPKPHNIPDREVSMQFRDLNDKMLLSRFLEDTISLRNIKAVVAYKSMIPYRLLNTMYGQFPYELAINESEWYKELVANNQDDAIKEVLVSYFDRFFARFYGIQPLEAEQWLVNLLMTLEVQPRLVNEALVKEAIDHFKSMVDKCQLIANSETWKGYDADKQKRSYSDMRALLAETRAKKAFQGGTR